MKTRLLFTLLFLLCNALVFGQNSYIKKLNGSKIPVEDIDKEMQRLMQAGKVDGLCLAILNNNQPVYVKSYGYKNKEAGQLLDTATVMYAASFSKAVFAFLTLKLVEEGKLDLDKPLHQYLKKPLPGYDNYQDLATDERWKLLTARMCLSHTTGLPNTRWINVRTGEEDTVGRLQIYFTPGSRYAYSGEGLKLLQLVEEEITGRTVEELAQEKVFRPFKMTRTGYIWHERFDHNFAIGHNENGKLMHKRKRTVPVASGSMVTSIADYSRFIENVMQGNGLSKKLHKQMIAAQVPIHSRYQFPTITDETTTENQDISLAYGLGWGVFKCQYGNAFFKEGHDDAWRNYNVNFPDKKTAIIIMTNSANGEGIFKELLEKTIGDTCTPWQWERYIPYNFTAK